MANYKTNKKANKNNKSMKSSKAVKKTMPIVKQPTFPKQWYYMATSEIAVSDIAACLDAQRYDIEVWHEAGVLEIGVAEKASIDMEACDLDLRDEYSNAFLQEKGAKALFFVTLPSVAFSQCEEVMTQITTMLGGSFCADTEDFKPEIS